MAIQFIRRNPVIGSFDAGMKSGDAARQAETEEFRRRLALEQQLGADKALRTGLAAFYAGQDQPPAAAPAAAPATGYAATVQPPQPAMSPMDAPDLGQPMPLPVGPDGAPTEPAPATPMPDSAAAAKAATSMPLTGSAPAAAGGRPASRFAPIMGELAKQSGTGQAMLQLFTRDQQDVTARSNQEKVLRAEGSKLMLQALKDGDIPMARAAAQQYGLRVPEDVWRNRGVLTNLRTAASLAKTLGIKDDHGVAFAQGFVQARAAGQAEDQAMLAGLQMVPRDGFEARGHFTDDQGQVQFYDKNGRLKPAGAKARPVGAGRGGVGGAGDTATIRNREDMLRRLKMAYPGIDESLAQKLVINPRATITPQDVIKQRNALQNMKDGFGRALYKNTTELDNAVKQVLSGAREIAGFAATSSAEAQPQPAPAAPASAPAGEGRKRFRINTRTQQLEEIPQ